MTRQLALFWAHLQANSYCLGQLFKLVFYSNPEILYPPMLVYVKWSLEDEGWGAIRRARQVGVGFWARSLVQGVPDQWVDFIIFFQESFDRETKTWTRVK